MILYDTILQTIVKNHILYYDMIVYNVLNYNIIYFKNAIAIYYMKLGASCPTKRT